MALKGAVMDYEALGLALLIAAGLFVGIRQLGGVRERLAGKGTRRHPCHYRQAGPHAKDGEAFQEQTRRIKEAEALVDAERKKETAKSGFVNKEKVCQKL